MKKLFITILLLIPLNVNASILDYDQNYDGGSFNTNLESIGNTSIIFSENTDFTTTSFSNNKDYIMFRTYLDIYYLYTNNYSQDWTEDDVVSLQPNVTGTLASAPSSYSNGNITCRIQHNYSSTTATQTAMACNYLGKGYNFTLQNKSHYREHEYDFESIQNTFSIVIKYETNQTRNCTYEDSFIICPNIKGKKIKQIQILNNNSNTNLFYKVKIDSNFGYCNKITQNQFNQIMDNDSSSFNSGVENIADNTALPNNSGLFDVLSSLSQFVGNLSASGTCNAIIVPIPFTNDNFRLPCMTTEVYAPNFPELLAIWQLIVRGVVYYYIIVNMLKLLKDTIDPFSMKLEVLDL